MNKCTNCKKIFENTELVVFNNKIYCLSCLDKLGCNKGGCKL